MRREIRAESDIDAIAVEWAPDAGSINRNGAHADHKESPIIFNVAELYLKEFPPAEMLIEGLLPLRGASLIVGAAKSGKTILSTQMAIAVARGSSLFEYYRVLRPGPAMIIEQDDPAGAASIKDILQRAGVTRDAPIYVVPRVPFEFGPELIEWLALQITEKSLRLVVLDSYTALRGSRGKGIDIVKSEQGELALLDDLAKRLSCAIELIHHGSKGSNGMHWSDQAAGSFAMSAATESQVHVSRFAEFDGSATERLIRARGRHSPDLEMVLRFRKETLDYEHVLEGGAAQFYPLLQQIEHEFGRQPFGAKELTHATGVSRATAHRQITRLHGAGAIEKRGYGEYCLTGSRQ